eukprot:scaffold6324_cov158-Ochromonas_danica.AAC.5
MRSGGGGGGGGGGPAAVLVVLAADGHGLQVSPQTSDVAPNLVLVAVLGEEGAIVNCGEAIDAQQLRPDEFAQSVRLKSSWTTSQLAQLNQINTITKQERADGHLRRRLVSTQRRLGEGHSLLSPQPVRCTQWTTKRCDAMRRMGRDTETRFFRFVS